MLIFSISFPFLQCSPFIRICCTIQSTIVYLLQIKFLVELYKFPSLLKMSHIFPKQGGGSFEKRKQNYWVFNTNFSSISVISWYEQSWWLKRICARYFFSTSEFQSKYSYGYLNMKIIRSCIAHPIFIHLNWQNIVVVSKKKLWFIFP